MTYLQVSHIPIGESAVGWAHSGIESADSTADSAKVGVWVRVFSLMIRVALLNLAFPVSNVREGSAAS